jgi:hypothetical protein
MDVWLRYRDLKARGIVRSRQALKNRIEHDGFPPGRMTGPNERSWTSTEIDAWREGRPVQGPAPRGVAKRHHKRKAASVT